MTNSDKIINLLKKEGNAENLAGMKRFAINTDNAFGVPMPFLNELAKKYRNDHELALELWTSGHHEARILAGKIDDAKKVTEKQMQSWVKDFDSWDVCDQVCSNLFVYTPFAVSKAMEWSASKKEYVKRAGFAMMACLSLKKIKLNNESYLPFLKLIELNSDDERNMVMKAVNWSLRQIGKRNNFLNEKALIVSEKLLKSKNKTALWIARDAYRELSNEVLKHRLKKTQST